ncbi:MAG TPA: hypothetical protein DCW68_02610 [Rhodospirillaceae bacterium]|nr:MAG: hypothetical protein A2018_05585 [Alphaproteobacteria bacterium GWF2_58_20]HAU28986.1 hypothetical protein [Rhodospirillaceae bacterium]
MSVKVEGALKFAEDFHKEHLKARKKAGRKFGREIVRAQRSHVKQVFKKVTARRLKRIQSCVGKGNGDLVFYDNSPSAPAHEEGATIFPTRGKALALMTELGKKRGLSLHDLFAGNRAFIVRNAKGNAVIMRKLGDGKAEPAATLLKKTKLPKRLGFRTRILARFSDYVDEVERNLTQG